MNESTEAFEKIFQLNKSELRALFSLEHWLTSLDIRASNENKNQSAKQIWLKAFGEKMFQPVFFGLITDSPPDTENETIKRIKGVIDLRKRTVIFCEALAFSPYFNIQERKATNLDEANSEYDRDHWRENTFRLAQLAEIDTELMKKWESAYAEAIKAIGGRTELWSTKTVATIVLASIAVAVTGGMAAPAIGGFVGGLMGLSGAAATSAGLAFLGGGAIATGGFGMAGGTVALIGGGALLGGAGGLTASKFFYLQHRAALSQLAKLEASIRVHAIGLPSFRQIIDDAKKSHFRILDELQLALTEQSTTDEEKKRLKKTAEYYTTAIRRLQELELVKQT